MCVEYEERLAYVATHHCKVYVWESNKYFCKANLTFIVSVTRIVF